VKENHHIFACDLVPGRTFVHRIDGIVFVISVRKDLLHIGNTRVGYICIIDSGRVFAFHEFPFSGHFLWNENGEWREL
jgi:hypothetical protein